MSSYIHRLVAFGGPRIWYVFGNQSLVGRRTRAGIRYRGRNAPSDAANASHVTRNQSARKRNKIKTNQFCCLGILHLDSQWCAGCVEDSDRICISLGLVSTVFIACMAVHELNDTQDNQCIQVTRSKCPRCSVVILRETRGVIGVMLLRRRPILACCCGSCYTSGLSKKSKYACRTMEHWIINPTKGW